MVTAPTSRNSADDAPPVAAPSSAVRTEGVAGVPARGIALVLSPPAVEAFP